MRHLACHYLCLHLRQTTVTSTSLRVQTTKNPSVTPRVVVTKKLKIIMNITNEVTSRDVATLNGATIHIQSALVNRNNLVFAV